MVVGQCSKPVVQTDISVCGVFVGCKGDLILDTPEVDFLPFESSKVIAVQLAAIWGQDWRFITGSTVIECYS